VDIKRFTPDRAVRESVRNGLGVGEAPLVFTAGRLVRKKGFEYLIDAAMKLTDIEGLQLAIAGDGDLRQELEQRAGPLGNHIRFLGAISQDEIARLCAAADIVAVPSVRDDAGNVDGLPNFALEALASGTPVVATRAGGLPQAIRDNVTGRLVDERDADGLAHVIRDLFQHPAERGRLGFAARADVTMRFSWARVAERFEAAYDRVRR
jgi:glycosyltransferase involved in cell wall biosynthesis